MSKKISLGVTITIALIAMAVTFSLTMVVSMKMFNTTVSSVKNKERQYNKLSEIDRFVRSEEYLHHQCGYAERPPWLPVI